MNTTGMELLNMAWVNQSSTGVVCAACGYVHEFVGRSVVWSREREATPEEPYYREGGRILRVVCRR